MVRSIKQNRTAVLCPHYNYSRFFYRSNWGWFYSARCITVILKRYVRGKKSSNPASEAMPPTVPAQNRTHRSENLTKLARNPEYLNHLTAEQFRKMYRQITDNAVMHPTEENIKAYMFMTNFLRLKALVFAHSVNDFVLSNPKYNMIKEIGETSWSAFNYEKISAEERKAFVKLHRRNMGIMAFIKNGCPFCMKQIPVLSWFKADYGLDVLLVSMNGCPENTMGLPCIHRPQAFYAYGIRYEPTILLVIRSRNNRPAFYPVGLGLTSEETLSKRVYYYAKTYYSPRQRYTDRNFLNLLKEGK